MNLNFLSFFCFFVCLLCSCKNTVSSSGIITGTSEHGYRYEIRGTNKGPKPTEGQMVLTHTGGYIGDKEVFSSASKAGQAVPYQIPLKSSIDSMPELQQKKMWPIYDCMTLASIGDSIFLWMPLDSNQRKSLPPGVDASTREIKLFGQVTEITTPEKEAAKKEALKTQLAARLAELEAMLPAEIKKIKSGTPDGTLKEFPSGVKMWVRKEGEGNAIQINERILVNYYGALTDGTKFEESYSKGTQFTFKAARGAVISGLDESLLTLQHGAEALIFIPADQAYGETGNPQANIPPNTDLVFFIEIL